MHAVTKLDIWLRIEEGQPPGDVLSGFAPVFEGKLCRGFAGMLP